MKFSKIRMIKVCLKFIVAVNEGQNSLEFLRWRGGIIATEASLGSGETEIAVVKDSSREQLLPPFSSRCFGVSAWLLATDL